ncbi:hypothetical protein [Dongia deserti]|uniref:hypothetical protein n=1 Tax=Dongia deserti TaxID=2268030 RepID=UPI0013C45321|nr:hypothetical protein [Dongia deserti]
MAKKPAETSKSELPPPAEGGSYMIKDGVRTRVEEPTKPAVAGEPAPAAKE